MHNQALGATINQHTKLVTITNLDNLQVEFVVPESELRNLGGIDKIKSAKISITLDGHLLPIPAEFAAHETVIDSETNAIAVRAYLKPNKEDTVAISPGQMGKVVLNIGSKNDAIVAPESAVEQMQGNNYVYKIVNGIAIQVGVTTGIKDGTKIEILSGLNEGDLVVTSGQYRLSDGQSVIIENEEQQKD